MPNARKTSRLGSTIEGRRPVLEAFRAGTKLQQLLVAEGIEQGPQILEILTLAREFGISVQRVSKKVLDRDASTRRHQGIVAIAPDPRYVEIKELITKSKSMDTSALITILDGIEDPQNFGAIARTVDGAGGHGVVIPQRRAVGITAGARRASAGALEHVPVARVKNIVRAIEFIKSDGLWVIGLDPTSQTDYTLADFTGHTAIVVGAEGAGLSRLVSEICDQLVSVPLMGQLASLNVSAATAVVLYEAVRQRSIQLGKKHLLE